MKREITSRSGLFQDATRAGPQNAIPFTRGQYVQDCCDINIEL